MARESALVFAQLIPRSTSTCAGLGQYEHYHLGGRVQIEIEMADYILLQGLHRQVNPVLTSNMLVISIMFILDTLERWIWTMFIKLLPEAFKWNPIFDVHCRMPSDLSPLNPGEGILSCLSYVQITLTFLPNKIIMLLEYRDHILQISNSP